MRNGHWLTETNPKELIAFCNKCCDYVPIRKKGHYEDGSRRYACQGIGWVKQPRKPRTVQPGEHGLRDRNDEERKAFCVECKTFVKTVKQGERFRCSVSVRKVLNNFHKNNPDKIRSYQYKQKYDITLEQYEKLAEDQSYKCAICKCTAEEATNFRNFLCVDHIEGTKIIRGLLCSFCNTAIGLLKHDPKILSSAILYLV